MVNRITLLLFIGLAFWGCEKKELSLDENISKINLVIETDDVNK